MLLLLRLWTEQQEGYESTADPSIPVCCLLMFLPIIFFCGSFPQEMGSNQEMNPAHAIGEEQKLVTWSPGDGGTFLAQHFCFSLVVVYHVCRVR